MASASDNFDRSDGEIGANWTEDNGDIDIVSNRAECQTSSTLNRARYTATQMDSADHYVQADVQAQSTVPDGGISARQAGSTFTCYHAHYAEHNAGDGYRLYQHTNESWNLLDDAASGSGEKTLKLTVDGATQSMEVDASEVCSDTDSTVTAGTYCGITGWDARASHNDFECADLAAAASPAEGLIIIISKLKKAILAAPFVAAIVNREQSRRRFLTGKWFREE